MGLVRLVLFAPLLGPEAFGAFRLAGPLSLILAAVGGLGLTASHVRFLPEAQTISAGAASAFARRALGFSLAASLVLAVALAAFAGPAARVAFTSDRFRPLVYAMVPGFVTWVAYLSFTGMAQGFGRFRDAAKAELLQNTVFTALGLTLLAAAPRRADLALVASVVGNVAAIAWLAVRLGPSLPRPTSEDRAASAPLFARAVRYSLWFAAIPVASYLFEVTDRWLLAWHRDLRVSGAYALVALASGGMVFLGGGISLVVARRGAWHLARGQGAAARRVVWTGVALTVAGSLVYSLAARGLAPLAWRLAGPEWAGAEAVLPLALAGAGLGNAAYVLGAFAALAEKPWMNLVAVAAGAAVNTGLGLAFIPAHGVSGAAWSALAAQAAMAVAFAGFAAWRGAAGGAGGGAGRWALVALPALSAAPWPVFTSGLALAVAAWWRGWAGLSRAGERRMVTVWLARLAGRARARLGAGAAV